MQQGNAKLTEPGSFVGLAQNGPALPVPCSLVCTSAVLESLVVTLTMVFLCLNGLFLHLFITVAFPREATLGERAELVGEPWAWALWEVVPRDLAQ